MKASNLEQNAQEMLDEIFGPNNEKFIANKLKALSNRCAELFMQIDTLDDRSFKAAQKNKFVQAQKFKKQLLDARKEFEQKIVDLEAEVKSMGDYYKKHM